MNRLGWNAGTVVLTDFPVASTGFDPAFPVENTFTGRNQFESGLTQFPTHSSDSENALTGTQIQTEMFETSLDHTSVSRRFQRKIF